MTVRDLRKALADVPDDTEVIIYVDLYGAGHRPFGILDEVLNICGDFELLSATYYPDESKVMLELGEETV